MVDLTDDKDFGTLAGLGAPSPGAAARKRAVSMAMEAYDEATAKKTSSAPQGSNVGLRSMVAIAQLWSLTMKKKYVLASVATLLIATPLTLAILGDSGTQYARTASSTHTDGVGEMAKDLRDDGGIIGRIADAFSPNDTALHGEADFGSSHAAKQELTAEYKTALNSADVDRVANARETNSSAMPTIRANEQGQPEAEVGIEAAAPAADIANQKMVAQRLPGTRTAEPSADRFTSKEVNGTKSVAAEPVSTFSIDVDTASYAFARNAILGGYLPDPESVRVEEMVNYFPYDYVGPESKQVPFRSTVTIMPTPWNKETKLVHIGIKGYDVPADTRMASNLVFLIDTSGSMDDPNKLPLLKSSFRMLVNKLKPTDKVSIVTYAGSSTIALRPTKADDKEAIFAALEGLQAGGGTAGADGIRTAYDLARESFVDEGVNRVFLATDGDFNVGASSDEDLKRIIERERKSGIFLSVLGFGSGNYNDGLMQTLAQNGNGTAAYIDTLAEAQKTLSQEATSSIFPIAKDVKLQVEFNPATVAEYRLVGYETRALARDDFNNDKVDAGEIGSGHRVTAIYEITPVGAATKVDDLRYGDKKPAATTPAEGANLDELAFLKIRYKQPDADKSQLLSIPVLKSLEAESVDQVSDDVRFSVAVAAFGQKLKGEVPVEDYRWEEIQSLASSGVGDDKFGYRAEFLRLLDMAASMGESQSSAPYDPSAVDMQ